MNIKFTNGSIIHTLPSNNNSRSIRSNFISCMCYDLKNNEFIFVEDFDIRKSLTRFIPEIFLF